jgi:hypothetical protein
MGEGCFLRPLILSITVILIAAKHLQLLALQSD